MLHLEIGCYCDGSLGHGHTRARCANLLIDVAKAGRLPNPQALVAALDLPMSDDAWEEYAACDWLNEHAPFDGATWGWNNGDFGLWPDEEG